MVFALTLVNMTLVIYIDSRVLDHTFTPVLLNVTLLFFVMGQVVQLTILDVYLYLLSKFIAFTMVSEVVDVILTVEYILSKLCNP